MSVKALCGDVLEKAAQIIHLTADYENQLEEIKQTLATLKDFDPEAMYLHLSGSKSINTNSLMPKHIGDLCFRCEPPIP
jgi:hypothetical protein